MLTPGSPTATMFIKASAALSLRLAVGDAVVGAFRASDGTGTRAGGGDGFQGGLPVAAENRGFMKDTQGQHEGGLDPDVGGAAEAEKEGDEPGNEEEEEGEDEEEEGEDEGEEGVQGGKEEEGGEGEEGAGDDHHSVLNALPKEAKVRASRPWAALPGLRAHGSLRFNAARPGNVRPSSRAGGLQVIATTCRISCFCPSGDPDPRLIGRRAFPFVSL